MIVSRAGEDKLFSWILERLHIQIRLYINDHKPRFTDTRGNYVELDGHGYLPVTLGPDDWRMERDKLGRAYAEARAATWNFDEGPPQRVYGWYATDQDDQWVFADRLVTEQPIILQNPGERLRVICRLRSPFKRSG